MRCEIAAVSALRGCNRTRLLEQDYIRETLSIYEPEHIYLVRAKWDGTKLTGWFNLEHYPFTKPQHINYVTAAMAMLYVSQLGYVLARIVCEEDLLGERANARVDEFFRRRDEGNIVIAGLDHVRFRRKIEISESPLEFCVSIVKSHASETIVVVDISFIAGQRVFEGNAKVAIIRPEK